MPVGDDRLTPTRSHRNKHEQQPYPFITRWRVESPVEEVSTVLRNAPDLTRWWPSVYLDVQELAPRRATTPEERAHIPAASQPTFTRRLRHSVMAAREQSGQLLSAK